MNKEVRLIISGVVQGVFYRASAQAQARKLSLTGFVRNLPEGTVELIAQGEEADLKRFIDWCSKGPSGARIDHIEVEWKELETKFNSFNIR